MEAAGAYGATSSMLNAMQIRRRWGCTNLPQRGREAEGAEIFSANLFSSILLRQNRVSVGLPLIASAVMFMRECLSRHRFLPRR